MFKHVASSMFKHNDTKFTLCFPILSPKKKKKKPQGSYLKKLIFLSATDTAFASPHCPIFFLLNATTMGENG